MADDGPIILAYGPKAPKADYIKWRCDASVSLTPEDAVKKRKSYSANDLAYDLRKGYLVKRRRSWTVSGSLALQTPP